MRLKKNIKDEHHKYVSILIKIRTMFVYLLTTRTTHNEKKDNAK
jgi:hypothetical protein